MSARNILRDMSAEENTGTEESPKSPTGPSETSADGTSGNNVIGNDNCSCMSEDQSNVNDGGFLIEKHSDVHTEDEDSDRFLMDNDDVESVSDHSDEPCLHSNDEISETNCPGIEVPTLWDIATRFIERHYERDIVKVKALYAQIVAYYRAKYPHEDKVKKSEVSDIGNECPTVQKSGDDNDDTKSDTSAELLGTETDGENSESEKVIVDHSLETCKEGSDDVIIGTISEVNGKNDCASSETGSGSNSSTSHTESESSGSQPDDENIPSVVKIKKEKSECVREIPEKISVNTRTLRNIDSVNTVDLEKENSSEMKSEKDTDEKSVQVPKSNAKVLLSTDITVKSPPLIDISNESTEDYNEQVMEEPSGSQVHGESGKQI